MSFLKEVAADSFDKSARFQEETIYVLPSKRSGLFLKRQFAELSDKPSFLPTVLSIEQFIEKISELRFATHTELLFELYLAYGQSKIKKKDNFNDFAKWATTLLQDFNEIDRHLIDHKSLFSYLSEIKKLKQWGADPNMPSLAQNYLKFWKELEFIYAEFQSRLLQKKCGYQGMAYRRACENMPRYLEQTKDKKYIFVGFNALNKAEVQIIQFLLDHAATEIYWDIDSYFLNDPMHSASLFIRGYQKQWKALQNNALKGISSHYLSNKTIEIYGLPKNISQAKFAGSLLKERYLPKEKTALVLSDESLLDPILNAIPEEISTLNITMGKPLNKTPLHFFFLSLFNLHINGTEKGFFYQDILHFLSNRYAKILLSGTGHDFATQLKNDIQQHNRIYLSPDDFGDTSAELTLKRLLNPKMANCNTFIDQALQTITSFEALFNAKEPVSELGMAESFKAIFLELKALLDNYAFIKGLRSLETVYSNLLANERLDYQGDPFHGLQVMGMLESRNLDFDTVVLTSVNEGILPSGKSNNSFIPYDVKREFSLPTYREKDAIYTYHFYRLIQRAKKVFLLYNTEPDVLEGGEKSRFITQMLTDENINKNITHRLGAPKIKPSPKTLFHIQKTPRLIATLEDLAKKGFSPSSLSDYIRNPKGFYEKHILKIDEAQQVEETMAHKTFGTVVHAALEELYTPLIGSVLNHENLQKRKGMIRPIIRQSFEKNLPGTDYKNGSNLIVFNVITKYLENLFDAEIKEAKDHHIKLLALEQELSCSVDIEQLNIPITLKGKLDRVDEKDGQLRIIDYKTGKVEKSELQLGDWDGLILDKKYNKAFQLLCYARMYQFVSNANNVEAGVIPIKKSKPTIMLFSRKESREDSITETVLADFDLQLKKLILEIMDPAVPFVEKES